VQLFEDELGKFVRASSESFAMARSWESFVGDQRGSSNVISAVRYVEHPACHFLNHVGSRGAPVILTTPAWTLEQRDAAQERGSHGSAALFLEFLRGEMASMVAKGFWVVLPYAQVRHLPRLRLSPIGVVPQRDRRPRTIVDYTFSDVNGETARLAPREAMQFGQALKRLLHKIRFADPRHGPVYMLKVDIADGFYRIWLAARDAPCLGVAFPSMPGEAPLVAIPLVLPMGWTESPPYFCAFTETVVDLANRRLKHPGATAPGRHRLDAEAATLPPSPPDARTVHLEGTHPGAADHLLPSRAPIRRGSHRRHQRASRLATHGATPPRCSDGPLRAPSDREPLRFADGPPSAPSEPDGPPRAPTDLLTTGPPSVQREPDGPPRAPREPSRHQQHSRAPLGRRPLAYTDVFVDDAIQAAQGNPARLQAVRRILLESLDQVFRPLEPGDPESRQEPASVKKMRKGDACWATLKVVLGWLIDTVRGTIELPPHRLERLKELFDSFRGRKRVALKKWYQLLGELRSMTLAIPGGTGMFSQLQLALRHSDRARVRLTQAVHDQLADFEYLTDDLGSRPTRIAEVVPTEPEHVGACDAARPGMGGVWIPKDSLGLPPLVWREPFPACIQDNLVTFENPHGTINNSELEMAGVVCHQEILVQETDCREVTLATLGDNIASVSWVKRGSVSAATPAAYLLRLQALHRRHHRYLQEISHIPGESNAMADDASRLWHLSNDAFLAYFNSTYPQSVPWRLCHLRSAMTSAVTSALQMKRCSPESFLAGPQRPAPSGPFGSPSVAPLDRMPSSLRSQTRSPSSKSSLIESELAPSPAIVAASRFDLEQWRITSAPLGRASPVWGPLTPARTPFTITPTSAYTGSSAATPSRTLHPTA